MSNTQRLPVSLTLLDAALTALLRNLKPVEPVELPLAELPHCVAAADASPREAVPIHDIAVVDGWALRASDLVGASSYTPVPLPTPLAWVEAGDRIPDGFDCVLDEDSVDRSSPIAQVLAEAVPGQGVRRKG